jgi:hypothetical protein
MTHGYLMEKGDTSICQSCGSTLIIKNITEERRLYEKQREVLNISNLFGIRLGPNQDNEINTIEYFKTIKILNSKPNINYI